jgi:hypothetical protein
MNASTAFDPSEVFGLFGMRHTEDASFERQVLAGEGDDLRCLFLWGHDCYNCNLFKQTALREREALLALGLSWFEADVYTDVALGRRFALHGVPAFYLFRSGKKLGRITGWPGLPAFSGAIKRLQGQNVTNSSPGS